MIIITGAAGFIGSSLIRYLNKQGITDILAVDDLTKPDKWKNLINLKFTHIVSKNQIISTINKIRGKDNIDLIIHLGACSDTFNTDDQYVLDNNYQYSKRLYDWCIKEGCRFIYASSMAVYGNDNRPLNIYAYTKLLFDDYVNNSLIKPSQYVGLRFSNVFGHNEYHKGSMASMVYQAYKQTKETNCVKLFKLKNIKRDFGYIKDIVSVVYHFIKNKKVNGIFEVGSGNVTTFEHLVKCVCESMNQPVNYSYKDIPDNVKRQYQLSNKANLATLRKAGYNKQFYTIEEGIDDYVTNYLKGGLYY